MTSERVEELEPCPFCGALAEYFERYRGLWNVHCTGPDCGATIDPAHRDHEDCARAWNTRSLTPQAGEGVVERVARAMKPELFDKTPDDKVGPATLYERNFCRQMAERAIAALPPAGRVEELEKVLNWFGSNTRLELTHYSPTFCDDVDRAEEWRVHEVSGSRNDREWNLVGQGDTPLEAMFNARAALNGESQRMASEQQDLGAAQGGRIGFDPTNLSRDNIDAIVSAVRAVKAGKLPDTGFGTPHSWALAFGYLKEEAINKPCRSCGRPQVDYRYFKITPAGRALLALAEASQ